MIAPFGAKQQAEERMARTRIGTLLAIVALLVAALTLLGQMGRWSDRWDAINIVLPYLVVPASIAALFVLAMTWRRRGPAFWLGGIALLAISTGPLPLLIGEWRAAGPLSGDPSGDLSCDGERLRIVQFNAWKDNRATPSAARWIRLVDPDLVLVEEARNAAPLPVLLRDRYPFQQSCIGPSLCSTLILSKRAPLAAGGLAQGDPENRSALSAAWMRFGSPGGAFTVVAAHLGRPWPFPRFEGDRAALIRFIRTQSPATTVLAGDFNLPDWTFQLRRLEAGLGLERRSHGLRSWPAILGDRRNPMPLLPIDHVFAGRDWTVTDIRRGPFLGSDHYPLVADLQRCPPARS